MTLLFDYMIFFYGRSVTAYGQNIHGRSITVYGLAKITMGGSVQL
jgi:hypothetical protein